MTAQGGLAVSMRILRAAYIVCRILYRAAYIVCRRLYRAPK